MSYINTISPAEAKVLLKAVKAYQTELQAEMDFREDLRTNSILQDGYTAEAVQERGKLIMEIKEKSNAMDEAFALKVKLQSILA